MGSGTSRGKKVAPACVGAVSVTNREPTKQAGHSIKPLKFRAILRSSRNGAQADCHSEGHDSELSAEEDDTDAGLDHVLADYEDQGRAPKRKNPPKKSFLRSRTYGLCNFSRVHTDDDFTPAPDTAEEPRGSHGGPGHVNKRSNAVFIHFKKLTPPCPNQHSGSLTRASCVEPAPGPAKQTSLGSCHSSSLAMPVILYDGSEEELMDTIEREFS
ncbi:uncharacterized protein LOC115354482 [Myripristis murdjan]|uniref:uncharacterized protein LOC115354482 n=1 Tax=Myripristis murdjan TaxID=586833 RepID=UPI001175CF69|nr:uncharacterized protein LOC115354482 [Myripristis murdjan]